MSTRNIALPAAVLSVALFSTTIIDSVGIWLHAHQPASTGAEKSQSPVLPVDVQARLDKLQADLKAAPEKNDGSAKAQALNTIGSLYFSVSDYLKAEDVYAQALGQARPAGDARQSDSLGPRSNHAGKVR